jgi:hypothetical protein
VKDYLSFEVIVLLKLTSSLLSKAMERQQLMNKKGANPSSTNNLAGAAVPAEEPGRLKYMNLQNI